MIRPSVWSRPLSIAHGIGPFTLITRTEAARLLGVDRGTLQRAEARGEGPPFETGYVGRARWYRVSSLLLWRSSITGQGPTTNKEIMELWCTLDDWWGPIRKNPPKRPDWWRTGERYYRSKRRVTTDIQRRMATLDLLIRIADKTTPLADRAFNDALASMRRKAGD